MHGMRSMHGMRFMSDIQKPDASEIANRMINNRDKDGDGALSADELGKLSDRMGLVESDFNDDGLIDKEKLISKISEKLEKTGGSPQIRGLKMYRMCMMPTDAIPETQSISGTEPTDAIPETQSISGTEPTDAIPETQSISDLVRQLLSQLDLSEEETESFLEVMENYGINVTA
jgi:hypothetical protein